MPIVAFGLIMLALLAPAMAGTLASPVMRLVEAVRRTRQGQLDVRAPICRRVSFISSNTVSTRWPLHLEEVHQSMQARIEEATAQLAFQARHDALTGLLNRREFDLQLERAVTAVQAGGEEFSSFLSIPLDRFKQVNDQCGHLAGDELLALCCCAGARVVVRARTMLARPGGDEFGVILTGCTGNRASGGQTICAPRPQPIVSFARTRFFSIGASIGMSTANRWIREL